MITLLVGITGRSESNESAAADSCATAVWPMIPATCISREPDLSGRQVHEVASANEIAAFAGQGGPSAASRKADLLHTPESTVRYQTLETSDGDGISVLRRIPIEKLK